MDYLFWRFNYPALSFITFEATFEGAVPQLSKYFLDPTVSDQQNIDESENLPLQQQLSSFYE
ncbi:MAG: hypothetical protein MK132_12825 [Lentisphaerales bacterium]|nr:hypothetical protein [Lentisphaerales bacterium]